MSQPLVALVRRATALVDSTERATDVIRLMLNLPAGIYRYEYTVQLTTREVFGALPAHVAETYFPEVFGQGSGGYLTVQ